MPLVEFRDRYGGSVEAVLRCQVAGRREHPAVSAPSESADEVKQAGATTIADAVVTGGAATGAEGPPQEIVRKSTRRGRKAADPVVAEAATEVPATGGRRTRHQVAAMSTPRAASTRMEGLRPQTEANKLAPTPGHARSARAGEMILSANGSPLGTYGANMYTPIPGLSAKATPVLAAHATVRTTRRSQLAASEAAGLLPSSTPGPGMDTSAESCKRATEGRPRRGAFDAARVKVEAGVVDSTRKAPGQLQPQAVPGVTGAGDEAMEVKAERLTEVDMTVTLETEGGTAITLVGPEDIQRLPQSLQVAAVEKIRGLQLHLDSMVARLQAPSEA
eukprot:jgi/Mesen1/8723/ME000052S08147